MRNATLVHSSSSVTEKHSRPLVPLHPCQSLTQTPIESSSFSSHRQRSVAKHGRVTARFHTDCCCCFCFTLFWRSSRGAYFNLLTPGWFVRFVHVSWPGQARAFTFVNVLTGLCVWMDPFGSQTITVIQRHRSGLESFNRPLPLTGLSCSHCPRIRPHHSAVTAPLPECMHVRIHVSASWDVDAAAAD